VRSRASRLPPYTTLFRSEAPAVEKPGYVSPDRGAVANRDRPLSRSAPRPRAARRQDQRALRGIRLAADPLPESGLPAVGACRVRSEEHASELQSRESLVC